MARLVALSLAVALALVAGHGRAQQHQADLAWSTFLGGAAFERITGIAVDAAGAVYVTGVTTSADLPTTPGAFQPRRRGEMEAFVAKLAPDGRGLVYLTYLGGADYDEATAIAVDATGAAYVAGRTGSADFPVTAGAAQTSYRGDFDGFVAKLAPDGSHLVFATFVGGRGHDKLYALAVDPSGAAAVGGSTQSPDLPTTRGAPQPAYQGELRNGLVARLDPTGNRFIYLSYLGGSANSEIFGIAVDAAGAAYVTGKTDSTDLTTTEGAFQRAARGGGDAFLVKLPPDGRSLAYATYLGGRNFEHGAAIAVDAAGTAYVAGYTASSDFPASPEAAQPRRRGNYDAFVAKLSPGGDQLRYSSFFGGGGNDHATAITVDPAGVALIAGYSESPDLPATGAGFQPLNGGGEWDAFLVGLGPDGRAFTYATYLGGFADDQATAVAAGGSGAVLLAGFTRSANFPVSAPLQPGLRGEQDAFVTRLVPGRTVTPPVLPPPVPLGDDCRRFPETNQAVCGPFLTSWTSRGGLAQFGFPLSPALGERNPDDGQVYTVQYFERARFEYHPQNAAPDDVLLGLLGRAVTRDRTGEPPFQAVADPGDGSWFPETGHTLRGRFRAHWEATGGLPVYGYPISEEFEERNPDDGQTYTVQYFERARFEWHPEHAGTEHEIMLGQLGRQVYARR